MPHQFPGSAADSAIGRVPSALVRRDIALFARDWTWLSHQPRGINASVCSLIDEASRDVEGRYRAQNVKEACYFFMRDMAGDSPLFEEACRALFSNNVSVLKQLVAQWPAQVANRVIALATDACAGADVTSDSGRS